MIYTTNSIEAVHRQFRKLTKTKGGFDSESPRTFRARRPPWPTPYIGVPLT